MTQRSHRRSEYDEVGDQSACLVGVFLVFVLPVPLVADSCQIHVLGRIVILMSIGLNIVVRFAGLLDLGNDPVRKAYLGGE